LTSALTSAPEGSRVPMGARRAVPAAKASGRYRFGEGTFPRIPVTTGKRRQRSFVEQRATGRCPITRSRHRSRGLTLHPSQSEFPAAPTRRCFCLPPGSDPMCSRRSGARQRRPRRSLSRQSRDRPQARRSCARVSASSNPPPGILTGLVDSCSMPGPSSEIAAIR
jgi:hypothetical protein